MAANGLGLITPFEGVMNGNNPLGLEPVLTPLNAFDFFDFGNSLKNHTGQPTSTHWTEAGNWMVDIAQQIGLTVRGGHRFGYPEEHTAVSWPGGVTVTGTFGDPEDTPLSDGNFAGHNLSKFVVMASNWREEDMGPPPECDDPITTALAIFQTLYDNIQGVYPGSDFIFYVTLQEALDTVYSGGENMSRATMTQFNTDAQAGILNWYVQMQNAMIASGRPCLTIPMGPILAWLLENESYLQPLQFSQMFSDGAPHGREPMYCLAGLICLTAIARQPLDMSSYIFPGDTIEMLSEITSNIQTIANQIFARLEYYNELSGSSRVIVFDE